MITELNQEETQRREYNSHVFELHKVIYCDKDVTYRDMRSLMKVDYEDLPHGYLCVLDRNNPVMQILTQEELVNYIATNCSTNGIAGYGKLHSARLEYRQDYGVDYVIVQFADMTEQRSPRNLVVLYQDEVGSIFEAYSPDFDEVEVRYASQLYKDFYDRLHS